jgi:syntaxin-binding protein 1
MTSMNAKKKATSSFSTRTSSSGGGASFDDGGVGGGGGRRRSSAISSSVVRPSLLEIVRNHLLEDVFNKSSGLLNSSSSWMVLVVDPESLRVVSSSVGMYNLMEHRVSIVEDLLKKRAPFRDQAVLYLVEPNDRSVSGIVEDWTPNKKGGGPPYGDAVFLYFLGRLPDVLFDRIKSCKELVRRVKVLGEVNLDFLVKEAMAYHFDMGGKKSSYPSVYADMYLRNSSSHTTSAPVWERMASKLVTVCATLNEYPHVRYRENDPLTKNLAFLFQRRMNEFVGSNHEWWYNGDGLHPNTDRATLLLLDRKDDCLSPLIHEFTYEAMVNDLLPIDDDRITYDSVNAGTAKDGKNGEGGDGTTKMDALLNDNDEVWVELRGKHIADVIQTLSAKIRDIVNSNSSVSALGRKDGGGKALSINQMAKALKALPEYREIMSKLSQHMQIAHQCMDQFNTQGLLDLSDLEQTLATGKTDEGRTPKLKELLGRVVEQFRSRPTDSAMRLRLLAIVIVSQHGLSSGDLQKLLKEANISHDELRTFNNLERMGCPLIREDDSERAGGMGKLAAKVRDARVGSYHGGKGGESDSEYSSSRYVCLLKSIMENAAKGSLRVDDFPSVLPLPDAETMLAPSSVTQAKSVRKSTTPSGWSKTSGGNGGGAGGSGTASLGKKKSTHAGRQIVFMAGGLCYSELRAAREVMNSTGTEIVIGSTRCISPKDFIDDIHSLG